MERPRILSGNELVAKGITKLDNTLPELGLKDVVPNGSWLEQKQIQSALEARKQLIEVERIEKCGAISHAEWRDELKLAEVMKKAGGHWQFLGHNVGKHLFLKPEEALYLMEVNGLQLTYNEVTVSLQQAYSLLLLDKQSLLHYKVYASLSRLGYKVFRHDSNCQPMENEKKKTSVRSEKSETDDCDTEMIANESNNEVDGGNMNVIEEDNSLTDKSQLGVVDSIGDHMEEVVSEDSHLKNFQDTASQNSKEIDNNVAKDGETTASSGQNLLESFQEGHSRTTHFQTVKYSKLKDLQKRKLKPCNNKEIDNFLTNVPDLCQKQIVTIKTPDERHIPKNVFLNNISYVLNLKSIRANIKYSRSQSNDSRAYSVSEEVNGPHVLRVSDTASNSTSSNSWPPFYDNSGYSRQQRQFQFWRPRQYNYGWRPFLPNIYFVPRDHYYPRQPPPLYRPPVHHVNTSQRNYVRNINSNTQNKVTANTVNGNRKRKTKKYHLDHIQRLATRLKQLVQSGSAQNENRMALERLIDTFNMRYRARLRLTPQIDLIEDEMIIDTIELEDEEEISRKKPRKEEIDLARYDVHLETIKKLSSKLKDLDTNHKSCSRHRRAFSHVVKKFNKCFDAEVYINDNYEVSDNSRIILYDSSDSDCIFDGKSNVSDNKNEGTTETSIGKKLKNPFNILKNLSKKNDTSLPSCSDDGTLTETTYKSITDKSYVNKYYENLTTVFDKNWLPPKEDFGRAEVTPKVLMFDFLMSSKRDEYIYDFIENQQCEFVNWLTVKISFLSHVEDAAIEEDEAKQNKVKINSIIEPDDCVDMASVLNKLSIIQTYKGEDSQTDLIIDFDVYNRDVQNFRKSNKPKPHFRVVCTSENSKFPSGNDINAIHGKYDDNVSIIFAIVGVGSISYLQVNPNNLPIYISTNDLT